MSGESASGPMWIATSMPSPRRSIDRFPNRSETSISGYCSRNCGRAEPSTCTPKPRPALTRSRPRGANAKPLTRSTASPILARMSTQRALSSFPASVRTTSRVVRCNKRVPSSVSNRATLRLTLDLGSSSARAAAESEIPLAETAHAGFLPARTSRSMGNRRSAMPVAAKIALRKAGGPAVAPVSPMPPGASPLFTTCTWIGGV